MSEDCPYQDKDNYCHENNNQSSNKERDLDKAVDSTIFIRSFFRPAGIRIKGKPVFYFDYNKLNETETYEEKSAAFSIGFQLDNIWNTIKLKIGKGYDEGISNLRNREICLQESYKRLTGGYFS